MECFRPGCTRATPACTRQGISAEEKNARASLTTDACLRPGLAGGREESYEAMLAPKFPEAALIDELTLLVLRYLR